VRAAVEDNGKGFDPAGLQPKVGEGRGLAAEQAEALAAPAGERFED